MHQLEFLLKETANWPNAKVLGEPYAKQLNLLKATYHPKTNAFPQTEPANATVSQPGPISDKRQSVAVQAKPPRESIPFDQWLLSERNIKIALYSGSLLLVLAGIVFIGVQWNKISGLGRFLITLVVTLVTYFGGYQLFQKPVLRLGGLALLALAAGFAPLNFAILQMFVFSDYGVDANITWLISSVLMLCFYAFTAYWTRSKLFTLLGLGAIASAVTALIILLSAVPNLILLAYSLMLIGILLGAYGFKSSRWASFTYLPMFWGAQVIMLLVGFFYILFVLIKLGYPTIELGNPWFLVGAMFAGVVFYFITDMVLHKHLARWLVAFGFLATFLYMLFNLQLSTFAIGVGVKGLALVYMLAGYWLSRRTKNLEEAIPFYLGAYIPALLVTAIAPISNYTNTLNLEIYLLCDVIILIGATWLFHTFSLTYFTTWVFIAPIFLFARRNFPDTIIQGVIVLALMLVYVATGYLLGRKNLKWGGSFLIPAAFLSGLVVFLCWQNSSIVSCTLILIATLYILIALWRKWGWLLIPALLAVNLAVLTLLRIFFSVGSDGANTLTSLYGGIGVLLVASGAWLSWIQQQKWSKYLYLLGALNVFGSYFAAMYLGGILAGGLSGVYALVAFGLAWWERDTFEKVKLPSLTYLGILFVFVGSFYIYHWLNLSWQVWNLLSASLCAFLVFLAWLLRSQPIKSLYGTPAHRAGIGLTLLPIIGSFFSFEALPCALTFCVIGLMFIFDAITRRNARLGYLAGLMFYSVLVCLLIYYEVKEVQFFALPFGLYCLVVGWNERRMRKNQLFYLVPTAIGLLVLMTTAFIQSFDSVKYAWLLLLESLIALVWGIRSHSRIYFQLGLLSLVLNGITQFGPSFVELPRWFQLGSIGLILLSGGMVALFRREQLLKVRTQIANEWKQWQS
ncbi:MAG TPA: hypothetical protein PK299_05210 [Anaerolineales bacterium]|nr:hypothetical protein [Anaerolineales bacterium]